jgi:hypothetical protein
LAPFFAATDTLTKKWMIINGKNSYFAGIGQVSEPPLGKSARLYDNGIAAARITRKRVIPSCHVLMTPHFIPISQCRCYPKG